MAISAAPAQAITLPGNVWLNSVPSTPQQLQIQPPTRVGGVSVTSSATQGGIPTRLFMKDQFLYTFTFRQGFQVVDLNQVVQEYQSATPIQFGQAMSTEGQGFATDAVLNTIPLPNPSGGTFTMWDLKADDFTTSNSGGAASTQTLLAAAGQLPFVLADPTLSGPQAVLYPPSAADGTFAGNPVQALLMTSADGQTNYLLCYGRAVALGTIAATDSNGNSTNKHIAVVVGSGVVGSMTNCPVLSSAPAPYVSLLAVVDLTGAYAPGTVACDPNATTGSPNCPKAIGFLQLPTGGTDVKLNGSVALVATGTNVLLVNLEDPTHPTLAGQITGTFGNWLTLTDSGILVGSSPNANSGLQTAALGSYILIQEVNPNYVLVDDSGRTKEPVQVALDARGQIDDFKNAKLTYLEDGTPKATIPVGDLKPGLQTVVIPAGMQMSTLSQQIQMTLIKQDGTETASVVLPINSPGFAASSSAASGSSSGSGSSGQANGTPTTSPSLPVPFDSVAPVSIMKGSPDTIVTVSGASAAYMTQVFVRGLDSTWNTINVASSNGNTAQFNVPAVLFSQAGFLEVAPTNDDASSIPLMVYNTILPTVGSALGPETDYADPAEFDTISPTSFVVGGHGFSSGMALVLGRGTTPGLSLSTTVISPTALQADIPTPFAMQADDLFLAVLSPDGSALSSSIAIPRAQRGVPADWNNFPDPDQPVATIVAGVDPAEATATAMFGPTEIGITSVQGNLNATVGSSLTQNVQTLYVCGTNLANGLFAHFRSWVNGQPLDTTSAMSGVQTVATLPVPAGAVTANSPTSLTCGTVSVPKQNLDTPVKKIGANSNAAQGGTAKMAEEPAAVIPYGGRRQFGVYQAPSGETRIFLTSSVPANFQPLANAVLSISNQVTNRQGGFNTIQLERESGNPPDPQYTARIRATALSQLPCGEIQKYNTAYKPNPVLPCDATMRQLPSLQATLNGSVVATLNLESKFADLGSQYKKYDALIAYYADYYGVPPQFLKSQAITESGQYTAGFRYEFTSIDLLRVSGDTKLSYEPGTAQRLFQSEPWSHYVYGCSTCVALGAYQDLQQKNFAKETQNFDYTEVDPGPVFELTVPVKRTSGAVLSSLESGNGVEAQSQVSASIVTLDGSRKTVPLQQVHLDNVWQKAGCFKCPDNISKGLALQSLTTTQFAVNYANGEVTLGTDLLPGQRLVVSYWPVLQGYSDFLQQTVVPVQNQGNFVAGAPNLNPPPQGTPKTIFSKNGLLYTANETLFHFLATNVASGKAFLTADGTYDREIEFTVNQSNKPVQPRDPRYLFMTSQPYASSSYGLLQFTLQPFDPVYSGDPNRAGLLNAAFNPSITPIYNLAVYPDLNFKLAANFHGITFTGLLGNNGAFKLPPGLTFNPCTPTNCNETMWKQEWKEVFSFYNSNKAGYSLTVGTPTIVPNGDSYVPQ